jgi:hypothetical protein
VLGNFLAKKEKECKRLVTKLYISPKVVKRFPRAQGYPNEFMLIEILI